MKKKKFSLNALMMNNKFLLVLSVIISLVIWIYMSTGTTSDTTLTLSNIPIQIDLSDEARNSGLQIYRYGQQSNSRNNVRIRCNRYGGGKYD